MSPFSFVLIYKPDLHDTASSTNFFNFLCTKLKTSNYVQKLVKTTSIMHNYNLQPKKKRKKKKQHQQQQPTKVLSLYILLSLSSFLAQAE